MRISDWSSDVCSSDLAEVGLDPGSHFAAEFLVAHLAAAEADVDLELVAHFQELAHLAQLDLVVAFIGDRAELDLLDLDLLGLLLGLVGLLLLVEPELAEVHDLADRRIGVGLDLDQVEPGLFGPLQGLFARTHADHSTVRLDHAPGRDAAVLVAAAVLVGSDTDMWNPKTTLDVHPCGRVCRRPTHAPTTQ